MIKKILTLAVLIGIIVMLQDMFDAPKMVAAQKTLADVQSIDDVKFLFPTTAEEINERVEHYLADAQERVTTIIAIPDGKRTFANTAKALDELSSLSNLDIGTSAIYTLKMVSPEKELRDAASAAVLKVESFVVDNISNNVELYKAFKAYAAGNAHKETLTEEQQYFVQETIKGFERAGLGLPQEKLENVKNVKKELSALSLEFEKNVAIDASSITVHKKDLAGLEDSFINALKKDEDGNYILGVDYPTYYNVMENCSVTDTRKKLYHAFNNRAYPANEKLLQDIIAKRHELANLLGFKTYAELDLDNQMVGASEKADTFLQELLAKANVKEQKEFEQVVTDLPESVTLTADKKLQPWDFGFAKAQYKKKHFSIDENKLAEFFPMENTVQALLDIYTQFLGVKFVEQPVDGLWHEDVTLVVVQDTNNNNIGYLLLDLYPRENKYSHACHISIVNTVFGDNGTLPAGVSVVLANFPKSTQDKPSLLKRSDVQTFFHEFGHALHALLGRTHLASFAGTSVKTDFVEMPSQMLEEWLYDKEILKKVSHHYKTGDVLSDEVIDKIIELKRFSSGAFVQRQIALSLISLGYYNQQNFDDVYGYFKKIFGDVCKNTVFYDDNHMYCSFGHLTGYGAKYYGYMWSKVFALDMFATIKEKGLLNLAMGQKYIQDVIGKGGSMHPETLLQNFLGRKPNQQAFLKDLGL